MHIRRNLSPMTVRYSGATVIWEAIMIDVLHKQNNLKRRQQCTTI
jgi:hypothetical protein